MTQFLPPSVSAGTAVRDQAAIDAGLRAHMLRVYNYLAAGIGLSALVAYSVFTLSVTTDPALAVASLGSYKLTAFGATLFRSPLALVLCLSPLAWIIVLSIAKDRIGLAGTHVGYWGLVMLMGAGFAAVFLRYKLGSIVNVFAITAVCFAGLSLWGYTTRRDISGWGTFLFMGLLGIILAGILNWWLKSSALQFSINCIGVLVFAGFTAYDTQQIKDKYIEIAGDTLAASKAAIWGALEFFLDFWGLFSHLLSLTGSRQ